MTIEKSIVNGSIVGTIYEEELRNGNKGYCARSDF